MAPSAVVAVLYQETALWSFVATIAICLVVGRVLTWKKPVSQVFFTREGFVSVALSWNRPEYYGRTSLFIQRMHHKPCGRLV